MNLLSISGSAALVLALGLMFTSGCGKREPSVSGKLYVTSAGDLIKFWDNGIAVEINGEFGVAYAGQAIYFGEDGHSPRTQCPYKQDGAKITLTIKPDGTTAVFTVNKDGSLTGPPEGIWGHKAFASLTPKS